MKRILDNEHAINDVRKENVIYTGTQNQVNWVRNRLVEKGISEKEIEIKLLTLRNCTYWLYWWKRLYCKIFLPGISDAGGWEVWGNSKVTKSRNRNDDGICR